MKRALAIVPVVFLLAGCTAAPASEPSPSSETMATVSSAADTARDTCIAAYSEMPNAIATLAEQSGEPATTETPCDNWVESQGEAAFVEFWTTPTDFVPFVVNSAKVEALSAVG